MSIAYPLGLLSLLALPLVVWLHRHVVQARRRDVSNLALWVDREQVRHEGTQRQRIPDRVVLALELLAALVLCALLSGLDLADSAAPRPTIGLVIDGSASMAGGQSERPLERVRAVLSQLNGKYRGLGVSIVIAAELPELLGERVMSVADADRLLAGVTPHGSACNLPAALELMSALGVDAQSTLLFSDDPELRHPRLVRVGRPANNAGIVHADWQRGQPPFVVVQRWGASGARTIALDIDVDGARQQSKLALPPDAGQPLQIPVDPAARRVQVSLPDDALALDNQVILLRPLERVVRVRAAGLSAPLQRAFERALSAIPKLRSASGAAAELTLAENPSAVPPGPALVFLSHASGEPELALRPLVDPFASLLDGFDGRDLVWLAFARTPPPGARVLLQAEPQALIWQAGGSVFVNAELERSNLLSHAAFPILLANLADELDAAQGGLPRSNFRQGERLRFEVARGVASETVVQAPSGRSWRFERGRAIDLGLLREPGEYTLDAGGAHERFAVQLLEESESQLNMRRAPDERLPELAPSARAPGQARSRLRVPLLLALLVLCGGAYLLLEMRPGAVRRAFSRARVVDARERGGAREPGA